MITHPLDLTDETYLNDEEENYEPRNVEEEEEIAGGEHGEIAILLAHYLATYVIPRKLGRLFDGQTGFKLGGNPPSRRPDVSFVTLERMPHRIRGEVPFPPDLAVEIFSPTDSLDDMDEKVLQYQETGVRLIWVLRPVSKVIEIYHPGDHKPSVKGIEDELDGETVLEGFKLPVKALFEDE